MRRMIAPALVLGVLSTRQVEADISSVDDAMTVLVPPVSVALEGDFESSATIYIIDEGISMVPAGPPDLFVNAFGPGPHGGSSPPSMLMPAGSMFHSYLVHFDPGGGVVSLTGSVTFDPGEIIFGIQTYAPLLYSTDGPFGDPLVDYPGAFVATRAFDTLPAPADMVTIMGDLNSATFSLTGELGMDQARIFTIPVPEPSSAVLLFASAAFGLVRRNRA